MPGGVAVERRWWQRRRSPTSGITTLPVARRGDSGGIGRKSVLAGRVISGPISLKMSMCARRHLALAQQSSMCAKGKKRAIHAAVFKTPRETARNARYSMTAIDEILDQEKQLANAKRTLDLDAIDRIYADDLLLTGVLGEPTCSKSAVIDEMRCGIAQRGAAQAGGAGFDTQTENEDTTHLARHLHARRSIMAGREILPANSERHGSPAEAPLVFPERQTAVRQESRRSEDCAIRICFCLQRAATHCQRRSWVLS